MNKSTITAGLISLLIGTAVQAADAQLGKELVEANCMRCHGSEVYTRPDHKVKSFPALIKQVQRCDQMIGLTWFDEDIENAATYLNQEYYKFEK